MCLHRGALKKEDRKMEDQIWAKWEGGRWRTGKCRTISYSRSVASVADVVEGVMPAYINIGVGNVW